MTLNSVLITGGTGSFGTAMLHCLLDEGFPEIRIFSRDEEKQDALRNSLHDSRARFYMGDIRDRASVDRAMHGLDVVIHAAALEQVPSCEFFPHEAVRTNVVGSENVIRSAIESGIRSLVCLSTDKAVMPINSMGMTQALMEKSAQAAAREIGPDATTKISCVRYGKVICSRGAVIPLFISQIKQGRPIMVTEPNMTRFLMPLRDSAAPVHFAFTHARQGDQFIKKAVTSTIVDLVEAFKQLFGVPDCPVKVIGWRHAEKVYETLASVQVLTTAEDLGDYWRFQPDSRDLNCAAYFEESERKISAMEDYHSHNTKRLDVEEVKRMLLSLPEIEAELRDWNGALA